MWAQAGTGSPRCSLRGEGEATNHREDVVIRFGEESVALDEILIFRSAMNDIYSVFWMIIVSCMRFVGEN